MPTRVLSIQQFSDTEYRAAKLAAALKNPSQQVDVICLDLSFGCRNASNYPHLTLAEYLFRFSQNIELVLVDSPQSFLLADSYLRSLCPQVPVLVTLRAGPLMEFLSESPGIAAALVEKLNAVDRVLLCSQVERACATNLGLEMRLCHEICTPVSQCAGTRERVPHAVSLAGNYSHLGTLSKTNKLLPLLSAKIKELGYSLFTEGPSSELTGLQLLPENLQPDVRIFVSDRKEFDNYGILTSLQAQTIVIASDFAAFGLGLSHSREYLAANHPTSIIKALTKITDDKKFAAGLKQAGIDFIQQHHSETQFLENVNSLKAALPNYSAPGPQAAYQLQTTQSV